MAKTKKNAKKTLTFEETLAAIGVMTSTRQLASDAITSVDIEETLADAVTSFADKDSDQRWLGPVLAWVDVHGASVIIEKLAKILKRRIKLGSNVEFVSLLAAFAMRSGHKRWRTLIHFAPKKERYVGHPDLAPSLVNLRGYEDWAKSVNFIVAKGSLLAQRKWTLSQSSLATQNLQYRNRLIYGSQWRADIITAFERGARTPAEASRLSGASYEPCHRVFRELEAAGVIVEKAG